jgi:hypothetical protein
MGKILLWLQARIKLWTKPAAPVLAVGLLSDLCAAYLSHPLGYASLIP